MNKIVIILLVVIAMVAGAGGTFVMLRGTKAKAQPVVKVPQLPSKNLALEERTVNLADASGTHYIKLTLVLELVGTADIEKLGEERKPQLYDCAIDIISRYTYKALLKPDGKKHMKEELMAAFSEKLKDDGWIVRDVLFSDLVME